MKTLLSLFTLSLAIILTGCAPKAEQTKLKVSLGAAFSGSFPGGVYVGATNLETGQKVFQFSNNAEDIVSFELDNGIYSFVAMGWEGTNHFEGLPYCDAVHGVPVDGEIKNIVLNATQSGCNRPLFGGFKRVNLISCLDVKKYLDQGQGPSYGSGCGSVDGDIPGTVSFFRLNVFQKLDNGAKVPGLNSACYGTDTAYAQAATNMVLPMGSTEFNLGYEILGYKTAVECNAKSAPSNLYHFRNGFTQYADNNLGVAVTGMNGNIPEVSVFTHTEACTGTQLLGSSPIGADPYLICTPAQFNGITNMSADYQLGRNIDFTITGGNTTVAGTFTGNFDGGGYTISGGDKPLFHTLGTNAAGDTQRIGDFTIRNFNINITTENAPYSYGLLAMQATNGGGAGAQLEIYDIKLGKDNLISSSLTVANTHMVGGLIGDINFSSVNSDRVYIENIESYTPIDTGNDPDFIVGGLVGAAMGNSDPSSAVHISGNRVGVVDPKNLLNTIERVRLKGNTIIGGVIGQVSMAELSRNMTIIEIVGHQLAGGLVGDAGDTSYIRNSSADMIFLPTSTSMKVGGVLGGITADESVYISGTLSKLSVPATTTVIEQVGGVVGDIDHSAAGNGIQIDNARAYLVTNTDGGSYGGLVGRYYATATSINNLKISNSLAQGSIDENSPNSVNFERGGLIGQSSFGKVSRSIANFNIIRGYSEIGGAFGWADDTTLKESYLNNSLIDCSLSSNLVYCGGIVGIFEAPTLVAPYFSNLKVMASVKAVNNPNDTSSASVGMLAGKNNGAADSYQNIIIVGDVETGPGTDINSCGASTCGGGQITSGTTDYSATDPVTCTGPINSAMSGFPIDDSSGHCTLLFESQWRRFSQESNGSFVGYKAGNPMEPFPIRDENDWNDIGTDAFLLTKTFELKANINFNQGLYVPLGADESANVADEAFSGGIYSNGFALQNITYTTSNILAGAQTSGGLIPMLNDGHIGSRNEPLVIENLNLICDVSNCGVIGEASQGSKIHIVVKNGEIGESGPVSNVGGLVGSAVGSYIEIADSGYSGNINVTGDAVGGLIGIGVGTANISIDSSYAKFGRIAGSTNVAGLIGRADGGANVRIDDTYVWFDIFDLNPTLDIEGGSTTSGLVGIFSGTMQMDNVYVDYSNANVPGDFESIIRAGAINSANEVIIVGDDTYESYGINTHTVGAQESLMQIFGDENDWVKDSSGRVRLCWETNSCYGPN